MSTTTLITNVNVFDGMNDTLIEKVKKLIAEKGAFLSTQTGVYLGEAPPAGLE